LSQKDSPEAVSELRWPTAFMQGDLLIGIGKIMLMNGSYIFPASYSVISWIPLWRQ